MSIVVLFHSALGRRPAVLALADALRAEGHTVHTPDLFDGKVFDRLEDGVAERDRLGISTLMQRAAAAVDGLPDDVVYMGLSMGAASAQWLAATRPGAKGAVLLHAALPPEALGLPAWPPIPTAIHVAEADPWVDQGVVARLAQADTVQAHVYPGDGHLFTDPGAPEHDAESAARVLARTREFMRNL